LTIPVETSFDTSDRQEESLADTAPGEHGRIGYGRYARYTPIGLAIAIVAALLIIGIAQHKPGSDPSQAGKLIGKPAPEFSLTLLDGKVTHLSDYRGKVVALNFWASWCPPCKTELPRFEAATEENRQSGTAVAIIGVGLKRDYDENAKQLIAEAGVTFPVGRDTGGTDEAHGPIETGYEVSNYPTTVFIKPDGTVSAIHIGEMSDDQIREYLADAA
jgi:cytochrome c biogenesis protein CcmG/thiol:disulfide interchange protein DsbE